MHGVIPPEAGSKESRLLPAGAEAGWSCFDTTETPHRRQSRSWTKPGPLPPTLLTALVVVLDMGALAGSGMALRAVPSLDGRPSFAVIGFLALICAALAGMAGSYGHAALFGGRRTAA